MPPAHAWWPIPPLPICFLVWLHSTASPPLWDLILFQTLAVTHLLMLLLSRWSHMLAHGLSWFPHFYPMCPLFPLQLDSHVPPALLPFEHQCTSVSSHNPSSGCIASPWQLQKA